MSLAQARQPHLTRTERGAQAQRRRRIFRKKIVPWLFALPTLLISLLVVLGPAISAVYYSMTDWSGVGTAEFTGLENYQRLFFKDRSFHRAFLNNVLYLAIFLTLPMIMALAGASLLAPLRKAAMLYRIGLFIPYVLPSVITVFIWTQLMDPARGLGAQLAAVGIPGLDQPFLGKTNTVLPAIAFIDNWHWWGFLMVLFLAGMQAIPSDLYEAARIDGANRWQEFRDITLPGIRPIMIFMILMTSIWSFLVFDYIWITTQGGPAGASEVLATLVYKAAFNNFEAGYAAAIGLTMSLLAGVIISVFVILRKRGWDI
jgi:raffinose/stachyose/melibiose transport system permease protein